MDRQAAPEPDPALNGVPGSSLLRFAGTMDPEVAREMAEAIEEGCERIESDDDTAG